MQLLGLRGRDGSVQLHTPPPQRNTHFLGTTEGLVTHLWQLQPDGLGLVSRAIIEFQARGPILLQWAHQVEPLQVFQGDGEAEFLGQQIGQRLVPGWWG